MKTVLALTAVLLAGSALIAAAADDAAAEALVKKSECGTCQPEGQGRRVGAREPQDPERRDVKNVVQSILSR